MTTFASPVVRLADQLGPVLAGRELARELRGDIVDRVARGEDVEIDLAGVQAVSPSFADELFAKLPATTGDKVRFTNISDHLGDVAKMAQVGRRARGETGATSPSTFGRWLVSFRSGPMTDGLRAALDMADLVIVGGHGAGFAGPDGQLPEITSHTVLLSAPDEKQAIELVRQAVEGHGAFGEPRARSLE